MTGQFVGFAEDGSLTFAMSVSPSTDMARPGTETARDDVYIAEMTTLLLTEKVCGV